MTAFCAAQESELGRLATSLTPAAIPDTGHPLADRCKEINKAFAIRLRRFRAARYATFFSADRYRARFLIRLVAK